VAVARDENLGPVAAEVVLNGGTLSATDTFTLGASRGVTLQTATNSTISVDSTKTLTAAGIISGSGNVSKTGEGTLVLTGANDFTGSLTLSVGTLDIGDGASSGSVATTSIVTNADLRFNRNDNTSTVAAITGTGNLTKLGTGVLTLNNTGTNYSGTTTVSAGTLRLGAAGVLGNSTTVSIDMDATFDVNNFAETIGALSGSGTLTLGSGTLTSGGNGGSTTFSGTSSGTGGLTKAGSGTLAESSRLAQQIASTTRRTSWSKTVHGSISQASTRQWVPSPPRPRRERERSPWVAAP
jgi:autotransporter-associated beta strand protein